MTITPAPVLDANQDVLIVGAGPAGLALAVGLAQAGLRSTVLEQQEEAAIATPQPDGRDIAMTHRARGVMEQLGLWQRLPEAQIAPLNAAHVYDGSSPRHMRIDGASSASTQLGFLVPNHCLRQVAYDAAKASPLVRLLCGVKVQDVRALADHAELTLAPDADGVAHQLRAPLLVAADSRYSTTRRRLGIGANSRDFGRTVIVARMAHDRDHDGIAHECFRLGNTLAILPMNDRQCSAVVTLKASEADAWMALSDQAFADKVAEQFEHRLGAMRMVGQRHAYPLVAVYAHRFAQHRVALVGDAAVGMHPVTAHGYNFGLYGVQTLVQALARARKNGRDIGSATVLATYDSEHRRVTLPIYLGTNTVVTLFTDDRAPARLLRQAVLAVSDHLPPLKAAIAHQLTGRRPVFPPPLSELLPTLPKFEGLASLPRPPGLAEVAERLRSLRPR